MKKRISITVLLLISLFVSMAAFGAEKPAWAFVLPDIEGDPSAGKIKTESCVSCHGETGDSDHNYYPNLAGQKEEYLAAQMHFYRNGTRPHRLMGPLSQELTDIDIADIAAFYANSE
jgi:cytochrome c553